MYNRLAFWRFFKKGVDKIETWSPTLSFDAVWIKWTGPGIAKWCYSSLQDKGVLSEDPFIPIPNKNRVEIIAGHCNVGNQVLGSQSKPDHKLIDGNLSVENVGSFQSALDVQRLSQCRRFRIENGYESSTRCRRRWWRSNVGERDADVVGDEVVAEAFQTVRSGNLYPRPSTPPSLIDSSLLGTNLSTSFYVWQFFSQFHDNFCDQLLHWTFSRLHGPETNDLSHCTTFWCFCANWLLKLALEKLDWQTSTNCFFKTIYLFKTGAIKCGLIPEVCWIGGIPSCNSRGPFDPKLCWLACTWKSFSLANSTRFSPLDDVDPDDAIVTWRHK